MFEPGDVRIKYKSMKLQKTANNMAQNTRRASSQSVITANISFIKQKALVLTAEFRIGYTSWGYPTGQNI